MVAGAAMDEGGDGAGEKEEVDEARVGWVSAKPELVTDRQALPVWGFVSFSMYIQYSALYPLLY
jgi:hypothetical protein